ncbi:tight junction protein ZO-1 [Crotalus adamanteus]|uniref:Tight junction protein ZO-1 n=1 Tax=Crotalus adamanteus TaxID=8729 RepID=A0AAW1AVK4_CROAD
MFGLPARPWFYNSAQPAKKERRDWNRWFDNILSNQRERIVKELDVEKVLSPLLYKKVFSWEEYLEVVSCREQAASLLEKLTGKDPGALAAFCSILEEVCPHWLLSLLLDAQGKFPAPSAPSRKRARRLISSAAFSHPSSL